MHEVYGKHQKQQWSKLIMAWQCIWHHRNKTIFNDKNGDIQQDISHIIKTQLLNWKKVERIAGNG